MMAGTRNLGTHAEALQVVVPALRRHVVPARRRGDPLRHERTSPQATAGGWSLDGLRQLLQLLSRQERLAGRWSLLQAAIPHARWTLLVVALDHPTGVVRVEADEFRGRFGRLPIGNQGEELPTARLH